MTLALSDGSLFGSRYRIVRRIAMGGMGAVYEVVHLETERHLALKVMLPHVVQSEEMRDRFRREARVAAHVESEHIVDVLDAGIDDATGMPFIVMELLRGEELSVALRRVGRFEPEDVVTFLSQAALALDKTHRSLIVHRDLKPENLFLTEREDGQPRIKVLDFGIAKLMAEGSSQDPTTRSLGTPLYMAPEQFRSAEPISTATDIYALGMIAYTLLVGSSYWSEEAKNSANVFMFAGAVMAGPRELATARARRHGVPLPAGFDAWFAQATAPLPQDRFPAASATITALADALGVARPASALRTSTSALRTSSSALGAPAPPTGGAAQSPGAAENEAATLLYLGGPPPSAPVTGPQGSPTGSGAYGTSTGIAPPAVGGRKIMAAVGAGLGLGAGALLALILLPGGANSVPTAASATAAAKPMVTARATAAAPPATAAEGAAPSALPSAAPSTSASTAAPAAAPSATARKTPAPPQPGKKTIYVRD